MLNGHQSHMTLHAIDIARDDGITMITLPPHTAHKMQPLDRSFFESLKSAYTADVAKAVNGFSACGIWPFNSAIFSAEDFSAAQLTDEPQPVNSVTDSEPGTSTQHRPHLNDGGAQWRTSCSWSDIHRDGESRLSSSSSSIRRTCHRSFRRTSRFLGETRMRFSLLEWASFRFSFTRNAESFQIKQRAFRLVPPNGGLLVKLRVAGCRKSLLRLLFC